MNPYYGCTHRCIYCYVPMVIHYEDPTRPWGTFAEEKRGFHELLLEQAPRKRDRRPVFVSSSCDPYQPLEKRAGLTRRCLELLIHEGYPISILTKNPLVTRDMDLLVKNNVEVGLTVTTDDEQMRALFEPGAPPIGQRLAALAALKKKGIKAYAFVGPMLPMNPEKLAERLIRLTSRVALDNMHHRPVVRAFYQRHGLLRFLSREYEERVHGVFARYFDLETD